MKEQLDKLVKDSNGKVEVVHVLSDEVKAGFEHGFITTDIIKKYISDEDYSIYACGPLVMYRFLNNELSKLNLPKRRVRFEVSGEITDTSIYLSLDNDIRHTIKVHMRDEVVEVQISESESIMRGLENNGILAPSDCKSGKCGFCRSRLITGDVYIPVDNRRAADEKFGWIHICSTYAKSDCEIEIFPLD